MIILSQHEKNMGVKGTDAKDVLLETNKENIAAQTLYKKVGFIEETNYFYFSAFNDK